MKKRYSGPQIVAKLRQADVLKEEKSLLAYMEMRLRKCREVVEGKLGMRN